MANIYDSILVTTKNDEWNYFVKWVTTTCLKHPFNIECYFPSEVTKKTSSAWKEYAERWWIKISLLGDQQMPIFENNYDWKVSYSCNVEEWIKMYISEKGSLWTWDKALSIRVSQDDSMLQNTKKAEESANAEIENLPFN